LPLVQDVVRTAQDQSFVEIMHKVVEGPRKVAAGELSRRPYLDPLQLLAFPIYFSLLPTLDRLQEMDALLATQSLQIPLFARRPYLAAQNGGDLWFEASRGDALGRLQRRGFAAANALLASNPWTFAHARRFGFSHAFYLPLMLDEEIYAPAAPRFRREWQERSGGGFFVLVTSRLDQETKGSQVAIEGFRRFASSCPEARLVTATWGRDQARLLGRMREVGLSERLLPIPLSGKRRLIDCYRSADCLLDQFVLGQYGATALEAMACGIPVVMRLEIAQYEALCETGAPPVLQADGPDTVAAQLRALATEVGARGAHGSAARTWFLANHSARRWADDYIALLTATALGHRFDFSGSPLRQPLGEEERTYHALGLAGAPPFPEYRVGQ
jgi:glycosyltransferase involved in cell wall biosynthesis